MTIKTTALIKSSTITIWFVALAAVISEIYPPLKAFFVSLAKHHWTGKSISAIVIFVVLYLLFLKMKESKSPENSVRSLIINTLLASFVVFVYFVWHYLWA